MPRGSVTTTTSPTEVPVGTTWKTGQLHNLGAATVFYQVTAESDALTTGNGMPLLAGEKVPLIAASPTPCPPVYIISAAGGEDVRYSFQ